MSTKSVRSDVRSTLRISKPGLRREIFPSMSKASKYDHGKGPKEFTHSNKSVASTGKSQSPKQVTLNQRGHARNHGR